MNTKTPGAVHDISSEVNNDGMVERTAVEAA
jgi:hypothetical protein